MSQVSRAFGIAGWSLGNQRGSYLIARLPGQNPQRLVPPRSHDDIQNNLEPNFYRCRCRIAHRLYPKVLRSGEW